MTLDQALENPRIRKLLEALVMAITIPDIPVKSVRQLPGPPPGRIELIQKTVAEFFRHPLAEVLGKRRIGTVVRVRHIAMYFCRELTSAPYKEIGRAFNRDHGTVLHACHAIENLRATERGFAEANDSLRERLVSIIGEIPAIDPQLSTRPCGTPPAPGNR